MRFKLDENLDYQTGEILTQSGHAAAEVEEEGLKGASDPAIAQAANSEGRCLITLDLGFANVLAFPPSEYSGLIVLRHPSPTRRRLLDLVRQVSRLVQSRDPTGQLWIVEPGRLRVHEPAEP